jgi:molybdopterin synthase sulfur carrier subunit
MKIRILFFAEAKRAVGLAETDLDVDGVNISDLKEILKERFPSINDILERSVFAVNKEYVQSQTLLKDGDTIAVIPPVEGG